MAKKNKKTFKLWKNRIDFMEEYWTEANRWHGWHRFIDYYNNDFSYIRSRVRIPISIINKVFAFVKTSVASLYFRDPHIAVNPKKADAVLAAAIKEQAINYYWREKRIKKEIKKTIGEAKLTGFSYMKVGFDADIRSENIAGEVTDTVVAEDLWAIHVPYSNVYYDPDALEPLKDARWIIHWFFKPTKYLQETYPKLEIKPTADIKHLNQNRSRGQKLRRKLSDIDAEQTKVFEIWDKDSQAKYLMCDGCEEWLEDPIVAEEEGFIGPLKIEGFPIKMLRFNDIYGAGRDNFPVGDIEVWEEQLQEKIKLRSMQLNHIKRFSRQLFVNKKYLSQKQMDKFAEGMDGAIIEGDGAPRDNVWAPPYPPIQTDIYAIENRIDIDTDDINGQPGFERGGAQQTKTRTLGEIRAIGAGAQNRRNEQIDIVEDFCEEISKSLIQIMKQNFDIKKIVRITGQPPEAIIKALAQNNKVDGNSIIFTKEDIQGEEDVEVKMGSSLPMNKEGRLQVLTELIKFGPAIGLVPGTIASAVLGSSIMKELELFELSLAYQEDVKRLLAPKEPSMQEKLKNQQTASGIKNTEADTALKGKRIQKSDLDIVGKLVNNRQSLENLQNPGK